MPCFLVTGSDAPADDFLARNGLRYGKVYGFAVDMSESGPTGGLMRDAFHKPRANGAQVDGKFVAINWQWDGEVKVRFKKAVLELNILCTTGLMDYFPGIL